MTFIRDIQLAAADQNTDVATLLRKCKILASSLQLERLDDWLQWESNGYPETAEVPGYRVWSLEFKGHFAGPFGASRNNVPIPNVCIPKDILKRITPYRCLMSVGGIETAIKEIKAEPRVGISNLSIALGEKIMPGFNCIDAWGEYSKGNLVELVNTVRNRVLDFTIALAKTYPEAGETSFKPEDNIKVQQIFNQTFNGGSNSIVGYVTSSNISITVQQQNSSDLRRVLELHGVNSADINDLLIALADEPKAAPNGKFGPKVNSWIGKMIAKATDGSWNIALGAAGNLLASALGQWYGVNP